MKNTYVTDNIMFSIILLAFFSLDTDVKAGGCCGNKIKRINPEIKKDQIVNISDKEIKWSKIDKENKPIFGEIKTSDFYENLGIEYFKNLDNKEIEVKNKNIKQYIEDLKNQIVNNIEKALEFQENKEGNNEKGKKKLFQIILRGSECVKEYEGTKIYGLKQYLEDEITKFYKNKGFKDYFLLAYILFKINKNIVKLIQKGSNNSLDKIIENLNYKEIIKNDENKKKDIGKFKFKGKENKTYDEFVLDFNDIDLSLTSLYIFNRVKYCFLVYLILVTNEIFDKFPFLVKVHENTNGVDVLQNVIDNVTLSYLLKKMLKGKDVNLDIYLKVAKTKFNVVKELYKKVYDISIPVFSDKSKLILKYDSDYFSKEKYFIDKKGEKDYNKIIEKNIKDSCKKYKEFYDFSKKNSNELHGYMKKIFEAKLKIQDKKDISIYNIFNDYETYKEDFNQVPVVLNLKNFTKVKIPELTKNYEKIYKTKK